MSVPPNSERLANMLGICAQSTITKIDMMLMMKPVSNFILCLVIVLLVTVRKGWLSYPIYYYGRLQHGDRFFVLIGLGAAQTDPPSGSVIANFEGTANLTTLVCNVTNPAINNEQDITVWNIANFRGVSGVTRLLTTTAPALFEFGGDPIPATPTFNFNNRLTILQLTSELDEVVVYCGIGGNSQQANFMLRIYRKWLFSENDLVVWLLCNISLYAL